MPKDELLALERAVTGQTVSSPADKAADFTLVHGALRNEKARQGKSI